MRVNMLSEFYIPQNSEIFLLELAQLLEIMFKFYVKQQ